MNKKPVTAIIAGVLLLILVAVSLGFTLLGGRQNMVTGAAGPMTGGVPRGNRTDGFQRDPAQQGQANPGNDTPRAFNENTPGFQANTGIALVISTVTMVCNGLWMLAGVAGATGLFLRKRWGITLAVLAAIGGLVMLIPSLLPLFGGRMGFYMAPLQLIQMGGRLLLAIAVMVLALLPTTRKACA